MPRQSVLHPEGARAGAPPDANAVVCRVQQLPIGTLQRLDRRGPERELRGLLSFPHRGAGHGPLLVRRKVPVRTGP